MLRLIDNYATRNVITGSALHLMALLYSRPGELRQAKWPEFDLENAVWNIPSESMRLWEAHSKALPTKRLPF
jgi:integrase